MLFLADSELRVGHDKLSQRDSSTRIWHVVKTCMQRFASGDAGECMRFHCRNSFHTEKFTDQVRASPALTLVEVSLFQSHPFAWSCKNRGHRHMEGQPRYSVSIQKASGSRVVAQCCSHNSC
jgi:hypothetical protein